MVFFAFAISSMLQACASFAHHLEKKKEKVIDKLSVFGYNNACATKCGRQLNELKPIW